MSLEVLQTHEQNGVRLTCLSIGHVHDSPDHARKMVFSTSNRRISIWCLPQVSELVVFLGVFAIEIKGIISS